MRPQKGAHLLQFNAVGLNEPRGDGGGLLSPVEMHDGHLSVAVKPVVVFSLADSNPPRPNARHRHCQPPPSLPFSPTLLVFTSRGEGCGSWARVRAGVEDGAVGAKVSVCCAERWSCSSAHRENRELP